MSVGAGQGLERLVGLGITFAAQDGLDAFGYDGPVVRQVALEGFAVEDYLVQALHQRAERDGRMGNGDADVTQHGRICQVALQARNGEFRREVSEDGVGDAEIPLGILEVDGVDFVGHAARVKHSMLLAKSESVDIKVNYSSEETDHPNTARIHFVTEAGREFSLVGVSIGGGNIEIVEINGMEVSFSGDYPTIIAFYRDMPGIISKVTALLAWRNINVAFMKVFRNAKRQDACMVIETDAVVSNEELREIARMVGEIKEICAV